MVLCSHTAFNCGITCGITHRTGGEDSAEDEGEEGQDGACFPRVLMDNRDDLSSSSTVSGNSEEEEEEGGMIPLGCIATWSLFMHMCTCTCMGNQIEFFYLYFFVQGLPPTPLKFGEGACKKTKKFSYLLPPLRAINYVDLKGGHTLDHSVSLPFSCL